MVNPARWAASTFWRTPPMGSTRPCRVTSPVMPTTERTGHVAEQADQRGGHGDPGRGPVLRDGPGGTWTWNRLPAKTAGSIPRPSACDRT